MRIRNFLLLAGLAYAAYQFGPGLLTLTKVADGRLTGVQTEAGDGRAVPSGTLGRVASGPIGGKPQSGAPSGNGDADAALAALLTSSDPVIRCLASDPPPEIHPGRVDPKLWTDPLPQLTYAVTGDLPLHNNADLSYGVAAQPLRNRCAFLGYEPPVVRFVMRLPSDEALIETTNVWRHRDGARACVEQVVRYAPKSGYFRDGWVATATNATGVVFQESTGLAYAFGQSARCEAALGDLASSR